MKDWRDGGVLLSRVDNSSDFLLFLAHATIALNAQIRENE